MINRRRVEALVSDLRSGKYKKGTGVLVSVTSSGEFHCCLGVGCERAVVDGLTGVVVETLPSGGNRVKTFDGTDAVLPYSVADWYGFGDRNPVVHLPEQPGYSWSRDGLTDLNDWSRPNARWEQDRELTHPQIADIIEWYYLNGGKERWEAGEL